MVVLQAMVELLDNTAQGLQAGTADSTDAFATLIAVAAFGSAADEAFAEPAPHEALADSWEQARTVLPEIQAVVSDWFQSTISSADVPGRLEPIRAELDEMWRASDAELAPLLGMSEAELAAAREEWIVEMQQSLTNTPTPDGTSD